MTRGRQNKRNTVEGAVNHRCPPDGRPDGSRKAAHVLFRAAVGVLSTRETSEVEFFGRILYTLSLTAVQTTITDRKRDTISLNIIISGDDIQA